MYRNLAARPELQPHTHPGALEICYLAAGEQVYAGGGRDYVIRAGDVFLSFPDEAHGTGHRPQERGTLYWLQVKVPRAGNPFLCLKGNDAAELVRGLRNLQNRHFTGSQSLETAFNALHQEVQNHGSLQRIRLAACSPKSFHLRQRRWSNAQNRG